MSPKLTHLDDAAQVVFWDLVPLLQPQTQSLTPTTSSRSMTTARGPHSHPFGQRLGSCLSFPERPESQKVWALRYQQEPQRAERCWEGSCFSGRQVAARPLMTGPDADPGGRTVLWQPNAVCFKKQHRNRPTLVCIVAAASAAIGQRSPTGWERVWRTSTCHSSN